MKVAITSQGSDMSSQIDPCFGRAQYFLLVDTDSGEITASVDNHYVNGKRAAWVQAAQTVVSLGAEAVIAHKIGPKTLATLRAAGADVYIGAVGTVAEVLEQFKAGKLKAAFAEGWA